MNLDENNFVKIRRNKTKIKLDNKNHSLTSILKNPNLKQKLVKTNADESHKLYLITEDAELGMFFAKTYQDHPKWGAEAVHLAKRYNIPGIEMPSNPVRDAALEAECFESAPIIIKGDFYVNA